MCSAASWTYCYVVWFEHLGITISDSEAPKCYVSYNATLTDSDEIPSPTRRSELTTKYERLRKLHELFEQNSREQGDPREKRTRANALLRKTTNDNEETTPEMYYTNYFVQCTTCTVLLTSSFINIINL